MNTFAYTHINDTNRDNGQMFQTMHLKCDSRQQDPDQAEPQQQQHFPPYGSLDAQQMDIKKKSENYSVLLKYLLFHRKGGRSNTITPKITQQEPSLALDRPKADVSQEIRGEGELK